jgi:hypothetical protein
VDEVQFLVTRQPGTGEIARPDNGRERAQAIVVIARPDAVEVLSKVVDGTDVSVQAA